MVLQKEHIWSQLRYFIDGVSGALANVYICFNGFFTQIIKIKRVKLQRIVKLLFSKKNSISTVLDITKVQCAAVKTSALSVIPSTIRCCTKFLCRMLLLRSQASPSSTRNRSTTPQPCFVRDNNIGVHLANDSVSTRSTLLDTNLVNVWDAEGNLHTVRAMIDPCSQELFYNATKILLLQFSLGALWGHSTRHSISHLVFFMIKDLSSNG